MSELEDKLNKILSSPAEMEKIMNIARSLSGSADSQSAPTDAAAGAADDGAAADASSLGSALGSIDPKTLNLIGRLAGEYTSGKNDKAVLLNAIKPYLKEDRRAKIDRAAEIAKLARLAKLAFKEFTGGDTDV